MPTEAITTADSVVDLLVTAGRLTRLAARLSDDDTPRAALRALAILDEYGAVRISEFARIDRSSQPAATTLIGKLVAAGYAHRDVDPTDSRAAAVTLTDAGRERLQQARRSFAEAVAPVLDRPGALSPELPAADRPTDPTGAEPPLFDRERLARMNADMADLLAALRALQPRT